MVQAARDIIRSGELGEITGFSGHYVEDYMCDPRAPFTWRCERRLAGAGALADLGSHLINLGHVLLGPIARVSGVVRTVHRQRVEPGTGAVRNVENEDIAHALIEFESGVPGTMDISRIATGYKCGLTAQVLGTRGSIVFDQERMNEVQLYVAGGDHETQGFRTILAAPHHPPYDKFVPAPGHGLGFNDLKIIECRELMGRIRGESRLLIDFEDGIRIERTVDAMARSAHQGQWVEVE
jgi:predicted dehydrogenase